MLWELFRHKISHYHSQSPPVRITSVVPHTPDLLKEMTPMANRDRTRSWHWRRNLVILATVATLLLSMSAPTMAITFGTPDGNAHPFVGSMVLRIPGQG